MATLALPGTAFARFNPISSALNNLPNGAGSLAALIKKDVAGGGVDFGGLISPFAGGVVNWYHNIQFQGTRLSDDDGIVGTLETPTWSPTTDWYIVGVTWPAGGAALERFHRINQTTPAGWTHTNSAANNGGTRAGPGTGSNGTFRIGYTEDNSASGAIALYAAWVGVALTDAQFVELATNNQTSDWWNNSGGNPTLLIECNTSTPTDIGANPSTFNDIGGLTLTGANPTWTFNGRGAVGPGSGPVSKFNPVPLMSNQRI